MRRNGGIEFSIGSYKCCGVSNSIEFCLQIAKRKGLIECFFTNCNFFPLDDRNEESIDSSDNDGTEVKKVV